jgi:hypothetical protein
MIEPSSNTAIPARDFRRLICDPSIADFQKEPRDFRKAVIAVWATAALIEHICWENYPTEMNPDGKKFLTGLAVEISAYSVIRDASNCLKHAIRRGKSKTVAGSASVQVRERGWGEAEFGVDQFGGTPIALIKYIDGNSASIGHALIEMQKWIDDQLR